MIYDFTDYYDFPEPSYVCECKLDNGEVREYHNAISLKFLGAHRPKGYIPAGFMYIGDGVIFSVNGVIQLGSERGERCRFYVKEVET